MEQTMVEMQYDTKKAPLGKITAEQIKAGYEALKRISEVITGKKSGGTSGACSHSALMQVLPQRVRFGKVL